MNEYEIKLPSIPDAARIVSASSASRLPSVPVPPALRGPDPKLSDRNESAYHSGNVGGESTKPNANRLHPPRPEHRDAGIPCHDLALLELTELGWRQSREVAERWIETPGLIVTSPYLRTQQTAAATIERFRDVPVEVWPIQEFTYLQPSRWNGTLSSERMPVIERYWGSPQETEYYVR